MGEDTPSRRLFGLIWPGALVAQAVHVAARLGIADLLGAEPRSVDELAEAAGAHPDALGRVLRALTSVGVFREVEPGRIGHTTTSETLRADHPESTREWAVFLSAPWIWRPWGELVETVRTGQPPFDRLFGQGFCDCMERHPDQAEIYDAAMSSGSARSIETILPAFDFSPFERIVDVGGGRGELLRGILEAHRGAHGVLLDLPRVVEGAAGLRDGDLAGRCEIVGADFFDGLPEGDLYLFKGILHGFADEDAKRLLELCRRAIRRGGRVLILEAVPDRSGDGDPRRAFMDLMMLALVPGRERPVEEFEQLLELSGFALVELLRTDGPSSIVVAAPR